MTRAPWVWASAGLEARLRFLSTLELEKWDEDRLKAFMYGVLGTGLPSYETSGAVAALCMHTESPLKAMFLAAEAGGDTDTIAALAAGLLSVMNRNEQMPEEISSALLEHNDLDVT